MAESIDVSVEEIVKFADYISSFAKSLVSDCAGLRSSYSKLSSTLDAETNKIFSAYIKNIDELLAEKQGSLNNLEARIRNYAALIKRLKRTLKGDNSLSHTNTLKGKAVGTIAALIMREHIKAVDSEYQTKIGYRLQKAKSIADGLATAAEAITGAVIKPPLAPADELCLNEQIDNAIKFVDGQAAVNSPSQKINRSASLVPQEQINAHFVIAAPPDTLFKLRRLKNH